MRKVVCDPLVKGRLFTCGANGFWMSSDDGATWENVSSGAYLTDFGCLAYDSVNKVIYAGSNGAGLFRLKLNK